MLFHVQISRTGGKVGSPCESLHRPLCRPHDPQPLPCFLLIAYIDLTLSAYAFHRGIRLVG